MLTLIYLHDLTELIEKKLYTIAILECARNDNHLTDCSLKPGLKGDKGRLDDQGKEGPQGMNEEPGVKGRMIISENSKSIC